MSILPFSSLAVYPEKSTVISPSLTVLTAGHTLFSAFTGSEALKIFREKELDIIVLDIMLPEMSGIVVLHEIRKISNIPVIMLTALDDEYTQSNSFDEMADDYISKFNRINSRLVLASAK